ncbi:MAG TPA: ATP-dependent DNA helicase RecQ [Allocoleopsis sp.]
MKNQQDWHQIKSELKRIWGYDDFRSPQGEIIQSLLSGKDSLIIMPTGGGKSICFQLPAILKKGLTLVISPLVALMENQVQELRDRHLPAALLHSQLSSSQKKQTLRLLSEKKLRLLYVSPETLLSESVWSKITVPDLEITGLILDEAHCLVQWGETFRPEYRRLGIVRESLLKSKPEGTKIVISAFTATADPVAQAIIKDVLKLDNPDTFLINPYRQNIKLKVETVWTAKCRRDRLVNYIKNQGKTSGLVYVRTRKDSENLVKFLGEKGYKSAAYHAGLSAEIRREIESNWLSGNIPFVVCTCAFGMGINKPDVRWIIHFHSPFLLSEYVQEIGRSGRDGKLSEALTLISEPTGFLEPEDQERNKFFEASLFKKYQQAEKLANILPDNGNIKDISKEFHDGNISLAILHSIGVVEWVDSFHYQKVGVISKNVVNKLQKEQGKIHNLMREYLQTKECRWRFLLRAFGFEQDNMIKCGKCDNCKR